MHDEPPYAQNEPGEGSGFVTLSDFSPTEILNHLIHNDVYFSLGWGHVKEKSVNSKMEFFFNCHSLVSFLTLRSYLVYAWFPNFSCLFSDDV